MLNEVKFADLGKKTGKGSSLKDLKKAAHSQGIDLGDEKRNAHHVDYPDAKMRKKGGGAARLKDGKVIGGSAKGDKIDNQTHSDKLRQAIIASGRVNKTPEAKAKRKKEADANRAKKQQQRDPFTRKKTFESFVTDCNDLMEELGTAL